jgi:hypothetical protein
MITLLLLCLLAEEVNAGGAPLGDVREPNLGAEVSCLSNSKFMLFILCQKGKCDAQFFSLVPARR